MKVHFIYTCFIVLSFLCAGLQSCKHPVSNTQCASPVSYQNDIVPIVINHCAITGCHVAGFQPGNFTSYDTLKQKADEGVLQWLVLEIQTMPPDSSITQDQRNIIGCWIEQGALNN